MVRRVQRARRSTRRHAPWRTLLRVAGTILASAVFGGCVFTPRTPEAPLASDVSWIRPSEPANVLANMKSAVEARFLTNYKDSIDESFLFTPSSFDAGEAPPDYFTEFGKSRELAAMEKLFTQVDAIDLNWNYEELYIEASAAQFEANYELTVTYSNGDEVVYAGDALLNLEKFGSEWRLVGWDESPSSANQSWGRLRANLDV